MMGRCFSRRLWVVALGAVTLTGVGLPGAAAATSTVNASSAKSAAGYTWTKYAYSEGDSGVSPDPAISAANASKLGVKWAVPDQGASEASPVVAYSAHLGSDVVYQGNLDGSFTAFSAQTGAALWSDNLGSSIIATPLVVDGSVWVARTFDPVLYKLNAGTGAIECQTNPMPAIIYSTPTMATPPGGIPTVFIGRESTTGSDDGVVYAINAANCRTNWKFSNFSTPGGTWDPYSYGVDADGEGLLVLGTDDPDATVYALDANTGKEVWAYKTLSGPKQLDDVGTGGSITAPGVNGFADGAVYISNNGGYTFALDLTTGKPYWDFDYASYLHAGPARATAAVLGDEVIYGDHRRAQSQRRHRQCDLELDRLCQHGQRQRGVLGLGCGRPQRRAGNRRHGPRGKPRRAQPGDRELCCTSIKLAATRSRRWPTATGTSTWRRVLGSSMTLPLAAPTRGAPTTTVTSPRTASPVANPNGDLTMLRHRERCTDRRRQRGRPVRRPRRSVVGRRHLLVGHRILRQPGHGGPPWRERTRQTGISPSPFPPPAVSTR